LAQHQDVEYWLSASLTLVWLRIDAKKLACCSCAWAASSVAFGVADGVAEGKGVSVGVTVVMSGVFEAVGTGDGVEVTSGVGDWVGTGVSVGAIPAVAGS